LCSLSAKCPVALLPRQGSGAAWGKAQLRVVIRRTRGRAPNTDQLRWPCGDSRGRCGPPGATAILLSGEILRHARETMLCPQTHGAVFAARLEIQKHERNSGA